MKFENFKKYEKPDLEELDLILEGSFLQSQSPSGGVDPDEPWTGGDEGDDWG